MATVPEPQTPALDTLADDLDDTDELLDLQAQLAAPDGIVDTTGTGRPVPLGRTPAIDFAEGRFVPNTAGGPLMLYGLDVLRQWVQKCLRTRRGENRACHPDFGCDQLLADLIDGGPFDHGAAAEYQEICERALLTHPAIDSIEDWDIDYEPGDELATISFTVIPADDAEDPIDIDLPIPTEG